MLKGSRIFVAGHRGLAGSAIVRALQRQGFDNLLVRTRAALDLTNQDEVNRFFHEERPEYVFLAAARVGGILANSMYPAEFIRDNLAIELNVIDAAYRCGIKKLQFLASSCIYPKYAPQPMREEYLLTGALEPTNESYAIAKIAGIKLAQSYRKQYQFPAISLMPTNLYGQGDNFDLQASHVLPALIRKFHEAKMTGASEVVVWGSGNARREFMHADDLAEASLFLMLHYDDDEIINVGTGKDQNIRDLAQIVSDVVAYRGAIVFDSAMPDGSPQKLLDISRLHKLGWRPRISLRDGISETYKWYLTHQVHEHGKMSQPAHS